MHKKNKKATKNHNSLVLWFFFAFLITHNFLRERPFSTYAQFSEKLTFLTP